MDLQQKLEYMRACLDARRDPALLPPERLLAAFGAIHSEVSFDEWVAFMGATAGGESQPPEPQPYPLRPPAAIRMPTAAEEAAKDKRDDSLTQEQKDACNAQFLTQLPTLGLPAEVVEPNVRTQPNA